MKREFQVGDKVRVTSKDSSPWYRSGDVGKVHHFHNQNREMVFVDFNCMGNQTVAGKGIWCIMDCNIALIDAVESVAVEISSEIIVVDNRSEFEKHIANLILG